MSDRRRIRYAVVVALALLTNGSAIAGTLTGAAVVVDGDTIRLNGVPVRLHGIDAPESRQTCALPDADPWPCGKAATSFLVNLIRNREVECVSNESDRYGRLIAVCRAAGVDLNSAMVGSGLAWAFLRYSDDYEEQEIEARQAGRGAWQNGAKPLAPWDYRAGLRVVAAVTPPEGCAIKGNVQRDGDRVYHTQSSPWYTRTRINTAKGERWFCSEAEALAAGWRAARHS